jgi:hypothetical protein
VVKYGIDERESMLTRENFVTWTKPKEGWQKNDKKPADSEDVAMGEGEGEKDDDVAGTEVKDPKKDVTENPQASAKTALSGLGSRPVELPIYRFQKKGIGVSNKNQKSRGKFRDKSHRHKDDAMELG